MIAVIADRRREAAVEEFFQLFKTPWEFYRKGRAYDVVIVAGDDLPSGESGLLVVYGSKPRSSDAAIGIVGRSSRGGGVLKYRGIDVPIYGDLLTLEGGPGATACVLGGKGVVALRSGIGETEVIRAGYDLFDEVDALLSRGQPAERASIPTLDIHVQMLREWILGAGIALVEIPPLPAGYGAIACLTHDIDFAGIRHHKLDHTMWGFLYRCTVGAAGRFVRGRLSLRRLLECWRAAASLPLVFAGWARDFWEPFGWYLRVERDLPATYFLIPFKRRPGHRVGAPHASRRATAYDVDDVATVIPTLLREGSEVGVHGIDAWHSVARGREELGRIGAATKQAEIGVRMHWLLQDENTFEVLERAGYAYDSSVGYNETIGYRNGTSQVFRPAGARTLLELPLHIQDGALFFPGRLDLTDSDAWNRCMPLLEHAGRDGGVVTLLWHDRSHAPERFWGDFYLRLVQALRSLPAWFGTAGQVVRWFRKRRGIRFAQIETADGAVHTRVTHETGEILPPVRIRVHQPGGGAGAGQSGSRFVDIPWNGEAPFDLGRGAGPLATAVRVGAAS